MDVKIAFTNNDLEESSYAASWVFSFPSSSFSASVGSFGLNQASQASFPNLVLLLVLLVFMKPLSFFNGFYSEI